MTQQVQAIASPNAASSSARNTKTKTKSAARESTKSKGARRTSLHKGLDVAAVFAREVQDVADGERQVAAFLGKVCDNVEDSNLAELTEHLAGKSESYARSLAKVLEQHKTSKSTAKPSRTLKQLLRELRITLKGPASREHDLLTTTSLQKIYHHAMASYGSLCAWSEVVGDEDAVIFFRRVTDECKRADAELTRVAESILDDAQSHNRLRSEGDERRSDR